MCSSSCWGLPFGLIGASPGESALLVKFLQCQVSVQQQHAKSRSTRPQYLAQGSAKMEARSSYLSQFKENTGKPSVYAQEINSLTCLLYIHRRPIQVLNPDLITVQPALVAQATETQCALTRMVYQRSRIQFPGQPVDFMFQCQGCNGSCFEINFLGRQVGSMVSSIICDRWLILSQVTLSN